MQKQQGLDHPDWKALRRTVPKGPPGSFKAARSFAVVNLTAATAWLGVLLGAHGGHVSNSWLFEMVTVAGFFWGTLSFWWPKYPIRRSHQRPKTLKIAGAWMLWIVGLHMVRHAVQPHGHKQGSGLS